MERRPQRARAGRLFASGTLFDNHASSDGKCRIVEWYEKGYFDNEPKALAEALTCSCFLGRTSVADFLLTEGVDPAQGTSTGLSAFHWAANRGNLDTVKLLIQRRRHSN